MPDINLAPGTQYIVAARKRRRRLFTGSALLALALVLIWGGLFLIQLRLSQQQRSLQARSAVLDSEIAKVADEAERIKRFERRLAAVNALLDQHLSWDPLLVELERLLPAPIVLTAAQVDAEQAVLRLSGRAPDMDQIAQAVASLTDRPAQDGLFSSGHLESVQLETQAAAEGEPAALHYAFGLRLDFSPARLRVNSN